MSYDLQAEGDNGTDYTTRRTVQFWLVRKTTFAAIVASVLILTGFAVRAFPSNRLLQVTASTAIEIRIDPLSMMVSAKDLPTQESLNLKMWPDNGVVRY